MLALLERLPFGGWALEVEPVLRGGIAATRAVVTVHDDVVVRTHAHIVGLVEEARLPERVAAPGPGHLRGAGRGRGRLHRRPVDQVHFHEVGGHDTIIDVVGTAAALEVLGIDEVRASPVATGMGMVRTAHGRFRPDQEFTDQYPAKMPAKIVVRLQDGKVIEHEVQDFPGLASRPFTWEESVEVRSLTAGHADEGTCREIKNAVHSLENIQVADLMALLGRVKGVGARH